MGGPPWLNRFWNSILQTWWVRVEHKFADEYRNDPELWIKRLKEKFTKGDYVEVFDFLQFVIRHDACPAEIKHGIAAALREGRAAYRLIDSTIVPISNEAESMVVTSALKAVSLPELGGSRSHLLKAGEYLTSGNWDDSVRESIHAVESLLITLEPEEKTLSKVLKRFETNGKINPNLKRAMNALYDFTSDEKGIRHAKLFENANVGEDEALYMFGVCASFLTFSISKHRKEKSA